MKLSRIFRRACGWLVLLSPLIGFGSYVAIDGGVLVLLAMIGGIAVSVVASVVSAMFGLWLIEGE
jgi:hypothetical protein